MEKEFQFYAQLSLVVLTATAATAATEIFPEEVLPSKVLPIPHVWVLQVVPHWIP
jgi:hypothetical protein